MSNLIIVLISIALIAVVAVAALYNGGDAFRQGSANGAASQLVNAGQQISAANILYANDNSGTYATDISELTQDGAYLSSIPRSPSSFDVESTITNNRIAITSSEPRTEICEAVNQQAGMGSEVLANESDITGAFGCISEGSNHSFIWNPITSTNNAPGTQA